MNAILLNIYKDIINIIQKFDVNIVRFFYKMHVPFLNKVMIFFTELGDNGLIWIIITAILLLNKKTRKIGILAVLSLLLMNISVNIIIKPLVHRPRPFTQIKGLSLLIRAPKDFSFPSGHTAASFAMVYIIYKNLKEYYIPTLILAIMISISRLYLSVHYPTDIIAGIFIGLACSHITQKLVKN